MTPSDFPAALATWRTRRGLTKKALAQAIGFDPSYVSHIEAGRHPASEDFARRAEQSLAAGGALWRTWQDTSPDRPVAASGTAGLFVDSDHAELVYRDGVYTARMRRRVVNGGAEPVSRYLVRISVDRYPGRPERSNELYRRHPLTWEALNLAATCNGEAMRWTSKHDKDSFKEVWLCFENGESRFPLYPGQAATLEYVYTVSDEQWGQWFQRAIRLPTNHVSVELVFPAALDPDAWGTETSTTAEAVPLRNSIERVPRGADDVVFSWSAAEPPIGARYRLEWRWRARPGGESRPLLRMASDRMTAAGIVQADDPVLARAADRFRLPEEAGTAQEIVDQIHRTMQRVRDHHEFGKGMGLAAPQIGIGRAVAVVLPPEPESHPIVLLNPRIIATSGEIDEQYEGCLSFFDVRGLVPRPQRIEVAHTTADGATAITVFTDALARLVAHEVDHLHGTMYTRHMRPGVAPIPVEEYRGTGRPWRYREG